MLLYKNIMLITDLKKNNYISWHCKRGMLELDEILTTFFKDYYNNLTILQQQSFELLLQESDADLFSWLFGKDLPPNIMLQDIVFLIRKI